MFTLPTRPADLFPDGLALTFLYDRDGTFDRIAAPLEPAVGDIVFRRVAAGEALDSTFRTLCAGRFANSGQEIEVTLDAAGELTLSITGQPSRRLIPANARTFHFDGLENYRAEFRRASNGGVDAIVFHQSNGTFVAQRVDAPPTTQP